VKAGWAVRHVELPGAPSHHTHPRACTARATFLPLRSCAARNAGAAAAAAGMLSHARSSRTRALLCMLRGRGGGGAGAADAMGSEAVSSSNGAAWALLHKGGADSAMQRAAYGSAGREVIEQAALLQKARRMAMPVGSVAGLFGSLVGVGGGVVIVPLVVNACKKIPQRCVCGEGRGWGWGNCVTWGSYGWGSGCCAPAWGIWVQCSDAGWQSLIFFQCPNAATPHTRPHPL
jgi:hypothetical protein